MWITYWFICLSRAHSTAAVSPWSSRCTSVRRICRAFARESIRSCVTFASAIDWLPVRWPVWPRNGCVSFLVFQEVQKACLLVWQAGRQTLQLPRQQAQYGAVAKQISICSFAKNYWRGPLLTHNRCWTHTDWLQCSRFPPDDQRTQSCVGFYSCTQALFQPGPKGRPFESQFEWP